MFSTVQSIQSLRLKGKCRVQLKFDGTRWRTGGEVKRKLSNAVGSQYPSHYLEHAVSNITTADAHSLAASSRLNWRPTVDLNGLVRLAAKTKSGFCACAITFQTQPTACRWLGGEARQSAHVHCCLQTVGLCASGPFDPEGECTIFFWKVKSPRLFTRWQTQRHISRDSHCHLLTTMEFQNCKIITSPASQTCQNYQCLCAWHIGKGESKGIALVILSFGTWWRWVVSFMPQPL